MPRAPVPPAVDAFLRRPNLAVLAYLRPRGAPDSLATWYDWEDGRVLLNLDPVRSPARLRWLRRDGRISLTAIDPETFYRHVTVRRGRADRGRRRPRRHRPALPPLHRRALHAPREPPGERLGARDRLARVGPRPARGGPPRRGAAAAALSTPRGGAARVVVQGSCHQGG